MALASSNVVGGPPALTDKVAEEDITEVNENGQTVVIVPKGQRIPEGIEAPETAGPVAPVKTEDKARRSAKAKAVQAPPAE